MKECDASEAQANLVDLEFPDWSGMDDTSSRITPDVAIQLCDQYRVWFPEWSEKWQAHRTQKCIVEFVL